MGVFAGIDLGTAFSAIATLDESGRPIIVHNKDGANITPSVVSVLDDEKVDVGESARRVWGRDSGTLARFKRDMGTSTVYETPTRTVSPRELSAFVLRRLKQDFENVHGTIDEAVVTIPANFSNEAREDTMAAAKAAGLPIKFIINEPTAAALYYAHKSGRELHGHYAVYDLGGGTFDISILRVDGQDVEVVATNGIARLGGDDFDEALRKIIAAKYYEQTGSELTPDDFSRGDAEGEKLSLSKRERCLVRVSGSAGRANVEIASADFENAISSMVAQTEMLCEATLSEAQLTNEQLSAVLLVGGSTRVPLVTQSVMKTFGRQPETTANVDEVVALGAALYAAFKGDRSMLSSIQKKTVESIKVAEITSKCFGTISLTFDEQREEFKKLNAILIKKGDKIPCSVTESFYTVRPNQTAVECEVTESTAPETDPRFVKVVWSGKLELPPGRPENQEIKVTFGYDDNQIMRCSFVDVATGRSESVDLSMNGGGEASVTDVDGFIVE